ncbi:hypothetical protein ACOY6S_00295 [Enterobacter bugandensis]|uniref:hypothetical protein n=1 Tax=Enterobacter bugandensis TaxID=881260 RepID=UPI003BD28CC0|nr:hypothetical protein [Enterobacter hormaechei subsp. steigerwaltii]HAV1813543.1 hypothetical protein [Enterobacter hormaechei subsp. steigerwaltii]HAV1818606.1 hypothetical protein [Enterobacter hormaechei subsp. steigerwaltii]HAV1822748.1 hypothetical protein [Enterobacter hormaechei subsp. steigerwaltii]
MSRDQNFKKWERILDPKILKRRVISYSVFISAFEMLKNVVIGRLERFYINFDDDQDKIEYKIKVLDRNKSKLYASLNWLVEYNALEQVDIDEFERLKIIRNKLSHEMLDLLPEDELFDVTNEIRAIIELTRKVEIWWFCNLEMAIDPDSYPEDMDIEQVQPMTVFMLQLMCSVALGDEKAADEMFAEFTSQYNSHN